MYRTEHPVQDSASVSRLICCDPRRQLELQALAGSEGEEAKGTQGAPLHASFPKFYE